VDSGQIGQVVSNLVINADQSMPEGGTVKVSAENAKISKGEVISLNAGRYVKISIKDSGYGIEEDNLLMIFDPYFTTKSAGSGLGLASAYSITKKHGGHISVESEIGTGTVFTIYLPASTGKAVSGKVKKVTPLGGEGRVLLMEDDPMVAESTALGLEGFGYNVEVAGDGVEAIKLYLRAGYSGQPFDAVVMDLTIPGGMGGKETIKRLREIDPNVRAIVASGYFDDPVMSNFSEYGFGGVLTKPFEIPHLVDLLKKIGS
jgi:CheY-like chemotaxis protein